MGRRMCLRRMMGWALGWALSGWAHGEEGVPAPFDSEAGVEVAQEVVEDPFDPDLHAPKHIRVQMEFVGLDHQDLTRLLFLRQPQSGNATELRETVAAMVEKGEAEVMETVMVVARSGERSSSQSVQELTYPTEFEPPEVASQVGLLNREGGLAEEEESLSLLKTPPTPMAFEVRKVGVFWEVEPVLGSDFRWVDLRFSAEMVWHTGESLWAETRDLLGNVSRITTPRFYLMSMETAITCANGQYHLVAVLSPRNGQGEVDRNRKVMAFVKCDVVVAK